MIQEHACQCREPGGRSNPLVVEDDNEDALSYTSYVGFPAGALCSGCSNEPSSGISLPPPENVDLIPVRVGQRACRGRRRYPHTMMLGSRERRPPSSTSTGRGAGSNCDSTSS